MTKRTKAEPQIMKGVTLTLFIPTEMPGKQRNDGTQDPPSAVGPKLLEGCDERQSIALIVAEAAQEALEDRGFNSRIRVEGTHDFRGVL